MNTTPTIRAAVITRQGHASARSEPPVCVYLLRCAVDENGSPQVPALASSALDSAHVFDNNKASCRLRRLVERAELLAQKVNANTLTFAQAAFDLEYGD